MVNFISNHIQIVSGIWQPHWNASKINGNQHITKIKIKHSQHKPSEKMLAQNQK
jgi:hypothetical protein